MKMFPVLLEVKPEGDHWLARCAVLDVMTQGKTFDEATSNLNEALLLFMESCIRRGTVEQVLKEAGLSPQEISEIDSYESAGSLPLRLSHLELDSSLAFMRSGGNDEEFVTMRPGVRALYMVNGLPWMRCSMGMLALVSRPSSLNPSVA